MFVIGIDPHRGSHTAAVLDDREQVIGELRLRADRHQTDRLLCFAERYSPRVWAVEGATGTGALLAQQLVRAGECVLDVPPTLSARVRLLDSGQTDKTDSHDARSAAVVALRHAHLQHVRIEDHVALLRLLARRHHQLTATRTRSVCRLHTMLCHLAEGHFPRRMSARRAVVILNRLAPNDFVGLERKAIAEDLLDEVRHADRELAALKRRITTAVAASGTSVTVIYGVGPIVAAYLIGHTGDIGRFPTDGHYARYNGSAPIEASSGPKIRHRLNPRGNRQLNHALYMIALTQIAHDTAGHAYYDRKIAEGKTPKEAMRALKRRISDVVYRQLVDDARR